MRADGALQLEGSDGRVDFRVVDGGFACDTGTLTASFTAEPVASAAWPPTAMFCLERAPLPTGGLRVGARFECDFGARQHQWNSARLPKVHAYFSFHALDVSLSLTVLLVNDEAAVFLIDATTEGTNSYDERASRSHWRGECTLPRRRVDTLWIPS